MWDRSPGISRISRDRFLSWEDLDAYSYDLECITRYED